MGPNLFCHNMLADLLRRRAREIFSAPNKPATYLLMPAQRFVCVSDHRAGLFLVAQNQDGQWLGSMGAIKLNDDAGFCILVPVQRNLNVFWINIQTRRSYNYVFLASLEEKIAP